MRPVCTLQSDALRPDPSYILVQRHVWTVIWLVPVLGKRSVAVISSPQSVN